MWRCDVLEDFLVILPEKNGRGDDEECTGGRVRERSVCMCVVLTEKEKEKENKSESDRSKREKREWIVWWVVGLGGEHVGTNNLIFFFFFFFFN